MTIAPERKGRVDLSEHGITPSGRVLWNPTTSVLYEHAVLRGEARIAHRGPFGCSWPAIGSSKPLNS